MAAGGVPAQALELYQKPLTAMDIRAQVNLIQEVMQAVMKKDVHYGTIPGCKKPSLYKPGSEKLLSTFHIAIEPIVEDLSTPDEARYRVVTRATSGGNFVGSGIGEASSAEEKYQWREAICHEEFEATSADRRRLKFKKGGQRDFYTVEQVRTNVADVANTVLKMAKKRSQIDVTLTVTGASDIFSQDIEDLPEEYRSSIAEDDHHQGPTELPAEIKRKSEQPPAAPAQAAPAPRPQPVPQAAKPQPRPAAPAPKQHSGDVISEAQSRRFYAICKSNGRESNEVKEYLRSAFGVDDDRMIPRGRYEEACSWAGGM